MRSYVFAVLLSAILAGCSSATTTSSSGSSAPSSDAEIKIGVDLPVSGADASGGIPMQNAAVLAIDEANASGFAGGKVRLTAVLLDDVSQGQHDPATGAQNAKTLIGDPAVLGMIGPLNSNVAKSQIPLTNDAGLVQISPATTSDSLTLGADGKALRTSHADTIAFFRNCTNDTHQAGALAQFAAKLGFKKAFIIDDNETYGKDLSDNFVLAFGKAKGSILGREHITANQQDFKALLTKVKAASPDVVFFGGTTSTGGALIRRQMVDVGMKSVPYMGGDGISDPEFERVAGAAADGAYFTVAAPDPQKMASAKSFLAAYKARFKSDVGSYSASTYAATKLLIAAIGKSLAENGGKVPTRADVLKNVAATKNFDSPVGAITFDTLGDMTAPVVTLQKVNGGKVVTVDVIAYKS